MRQSNKTWPGEREEIGKRQPDSSYTEADYSRQALSDLIWGKYDGTGD